MKEARAAADALRAAIATVDRELADSTPSAEVEELREEIGVLRARPDG